MSGFMWNVAPSIRCCPISSKVEGSCRIFNVLYEWKCVVEHGIQIVLDVVYPQFVVFFLCEVFKFMSFKQIGVHDSLEVVVVVGSVRRGSHFVG